MEDMKRAAAEMDIHRSGRLQHLQSNGRRQLRPYVLRNYGVLECPETGSSLNLANSTHRATPSRRSIEITERTAHRAGTCFSLRLQARTDAEYSLWVTALEHVRSHTLGALYAVSADVVLGVGATSVIFAALRRRDGLPVAIKAISRKETLMASVVATYVARAIRDMPLCASLPTCLDVFHTSNETHIVMERLEGPSLHSWLRRSTPSEATARTMFMHVLTALQFLHARGIVHGAVTSRNIHFASPPEQPEPLVKLVGFSAASMFSPTKRRYFPQRRLEDVMTSLAGDGLQYIAPELIEGKATAPATDFWALGCVLYEMLLGCLPLADYGYPPLHGEEAIDRLKDFTNVGRFDLKLRMLFPTENPRVAALSADARSMLSQLLCSNRSQRMNSAAIMRHPWLAYARPPPKAPNSNSMRPAGVFVRE